MFLSLAIMHLFLIGYRATGKSAVSIELGKRMDLPVVDLDVVVSTATGRSIVEIFERFGESGFRELESKNLSKIVANADSVISLGGGAILSRENRELIRHRGKSVWLEASASVIHERMLRDPGTIANRPALSDESALDEINLLLGVRNPLYAEMADKRIRTDHLSIDQVVDEIHGWCNRKPENDSG